MNDLCILGVLSVLSLILGYIRYSSIFLNYSFKENEKKPYEKTPWQSRFIEMWNSFVSFFIGGIIGYYFVSIRLNFLLNGGVVSASDFILIFIFALCLFGHLPLFSLNITKGIEAILKKVLEK